MDALKVKNVYWQKRRAIPNTSWTISGYSRSAYRTGFHIPELDIMLDAGPQNHNAPTTIFITHAHIDHIAGLPFTMLGATRDKKFMVYAPAEAVPYIASYVQGMFDANATAKITIDWCKYGLVKANDHFRCNAKNTIIDVEVFGCDHRVPTVSYGISEVRSKLKPEYAGVPGKEIAALRKSGVEITSEQPTKKLAYVCDTSIAVFDMHPEILQYPTLFIECTFTTDDEAANAESTKHIHWLQLKPFVVKHTDVHFVLFHFSQRLTDDQLTEFFTQENLPNLSWW